MQDLKRQSNRRPVARHLRTSSMRVRKNHSNPIPGLSVKLRKPNTESGYKNSWLPPYFLENEPDLVRKKIHSLLKQFLGICGLIFIFWLVGGSVWVGQWFFKQPLSKVNVKGNLLLKDFDVLNASELRQGQRLLDLNPYQVAARLQTHPIVEKADIRRIFPNKINLIISEYQPVAVLQLSLQEEILKPVSLSKTKYVLIGNNQRLLKLLTFDVLRDSPYRKLPQINGLVVQSVTLGSRLDSPVLERGLRFLATFQRMVGAQQGKQLNPYFKLENEFRKVNWASQPIHIDISDPLNLKIKWPINLSEIQPRSLKHLPTVPLTIQMGSRDFSKRLNTFRSIYPVLDKQHPGLKSIDLRYKNRVMLVP